MQTPTVIADMVTQLGGPQIYRMAFKGSLYDAEPKAGSPYAARLALEIAPALVRETSHKATRVQIELGWDDVYTVTMYRKGAYNRRTFEYSADVVLASESMVYADTLRATVEKMTGFILRLF